VCPVWVGRQVADRRDEAIVQRILGDLHAGDGEWPEAVKLYRASLPILTDLGDDRTGAITRRYLARAHHHLQEWDAAQVEYERSREVFRQLCTPRQRQPTARSATR
jgi:uncharacterized protein HemY